MTAMALKFTLFYNQDQQGWTEVFYNNGTNPFTALQAIPTNLWRAANKFRAVGTDLFAARASLIGGTRTSYSLSLTGKYPPLIPDPNLNTPQVTADVLLVKMRSDTGDVRPLYLRGLAYADVLRKSDGSANPSGRLLSSVADYFNALRSAGWCLQKGNRPVLPGPGWFYPINVAPSVLSNVSNLSMVAVPVGVVAGTQLLFQGVDRNKLPGFPRIATVVGINLIAVPNTIAINWVYRAPNTPQFVKNSFRFCLYSNNYPAISSFETAQFTTHKTGRPFGEPRGRSRAVVKAQ
jgi:hypothetical protein